MMILQNLHRRRIKKSRQAPSQNSTNSPENSWTRVGCRQHGPAEIKEQLFCCTVCCVTFTSEGGRRRSLLSETRCCSIQVTPCAWLIYIESQIHNSCRLQVLQLYYRLHARPPSWIVSFGVGGASLTFWVGYLTWEGILDSGLVASIFT